MAKHTVNFGHDLSAVRAHLQARVDAQSAVATPIAAIEVGLKLCQQGLLAINFDVRSHHERDGEWTYALNGPALELPGWSKAYMQAGRFGISFELLDGTSLTLPPRSGDAAVARVFGATVLKVLRDAVAQGVFRSLPLRDDCQVEVLEFDWMWEWPAEANDLGRTNLFRDLLTSPLPTASDLPEVQPVPTQPEVQPVPTQPDPQVIVNVLASRAGLTVAQARAFLQAQAELAGELAAQGYPIPGIGLLTRTERPARTMTMAFGPRKGESVEVPATRKLKFTIAPAVKDVALGQRPAMPDVFSLEWYSLYAADDE